MKSLHILVFLFGTHLLGVIGECNIYRDTISTIIGEGEQGTVFDTGDDIAIKAYRDAVNCATEATPEWNMLKYIHDSFEEAKHSPTLQFLQILKTPRPVEFCQEAKQFGDDQFPCYIAMERLNGLPKGALGKLRAPISLRTLKLTRTEQATVKQKIQDSTDIMVHPAFNHDSLSEFKGYQFSHSGNNRGYFLSEKAYENKKQKVPFFHKAPTANDIKHVMGFVYGYMLYQLHLIPSDIEFTFGLYHGDTIELNLFDFGKVKNIETYPIEKSIGRMIKEWRESERKDKDWADLEAFTEDYCMRGGPYVNPGDKSVKKSFLDAKSYAPFKEEKLFIEKRPHDQPAPFKEEKLFREERAHDKPEFRPAPFKEARSFITKDISKPEFRPAPFKEARSFITKYPDAKKEYQDYLLNDEQYDDGSYMEEYNPAVDDEYPYLLREVEHDLMTRNSKHYYDNYGLIVVLPILAIFILCCLLMVICYICGVMSAFIGSHMIKNCKNGKSNETDSQHNDTELV